MCWSESTTAQDLISGQSFEPATSLFEKAEPLYQRVLAIDKRPLAEELEADFKIKVRVYNYAHVSTRTLDRTLKEAARILGKAGIGSEWLDCLSLMGLQSPPSPCRSRFGPLDLVLRILAERGSSGTSFRDSHLGFALPAEEGGTHASIFFPNVEAIAFGEGINENQLLGHAIAHEIGHLLLNDSSHSSSGLMRGKWEPKDLLRASRGDLLFDRNQAALMSAELHRRRMRR